MASHGQITEQYATGCSWSAFEFANDFSVRGIKLLSLFIHAKLLWATFSVKHKIKKLWKLCGLLFSMLSLQTGTGACSFKCNHTNIINTVHLTCNLIQFFWSHMWCNFWKTVGCHAGTFSGNSKNRLNVNFCQNLVFIIFFFFLSFSRSFYPNWLTNKKK